MTDRFDNEVETALARPGMSYSMAEKIKKYPAWARAKVTAHAHQTAQNWRDDAARRIDDVTPVLDDALVSLLDIEKALDDGSMSAVESIEALNAVRGRVQTAERNYDTACATDARADAVHAEPISYVERLYDTYPALSGRITLYDYLAEIENQVNPMDRAYLRRL